MQIVDIPGYKAAYIGSQLLWPSVIEARGRISQGRLKATDPYVIVEMEQPWPAEVDASNVRFVSVNGVERVFPQVNRVSDWHYQKIVTFFLDLPSGVSAAVGAPVVIEYSL